MKKEEFDLQYRGGGTKNQKGIWLKIDDVDYLVNPYELSNSLQSNEHFPVDLYRFASLSERPDYIMKADLSVTIDNVKIGFNTPTSHKEYNLDRKVYFLTVSGILLEFCEDCKSSIPSIYGDTIEKECLQTIEKQAQTASFFLWPYRLTINDITIEEFSLTFDDELECDVHFTAKIGNRTIESFITDWTSRFDYIRHQIESLMFLDSSEIEINYEDEPTIFRFTSRRALTDTKKAGEGIAFNYKDLLYVQIIPNDFTKLPAVAGYCEVMPTIRTMYEALLQLGLNFALCKDEDILNQWHYSCGLNIYNTLKSGIVENYLCPDSISSEVVKRQTVVSHIITICCDKDKLGFFENGDYIYIFKNEEDRVQIDGFHSFIVEGIKQWEKQMLNADADFDWAKWDETGLLFAKEMRNRIPDEYDIWYQMRNGKRTLVLKSV